MQTRSAASQLIQKTVKKKKKSFKKSSKMTKFLVLFAILALIAISVTAPPDPKAVVVSSSAKKVPKVGLHLIITQVEIKDRRKSKHSNLFIRPKLELKNCKIFTP